MINIECNLTVHNRFDFECQKVDGTIEHAQAENMVLNSFNAYFNSNNSSNPFYQITIGTGDTPVDPTQTALDSVLGYPIVASLVSSSIDGDTCTVVKRATFPANSTYVGQVKEVGFRGDSLATRALITDSEGNQTSIDKTDLDTLVVTATYYVVVTMPAGMRWLNRDTFFSSFISVNTTARIYAGFISLYGMFRESCLPPYNPSGTYNALATYTSNNGRTMSYTNRRVPVEEQNNGFYNALFFSSNSSLSIQPDTNTNVIAIDLPNAEYFTPYLSSNFAVGTGDGTTTEFDPIIPDWVSGTEEVRVNGVLQERDVDYTVDNLANISANVSSTNVWTRHPDKCALSGTGTTVTTPQANIFSQRYTTLLSSTTPIELTFDQPRLCNAVVIPYLYGENGSIALNYLAVEAYVNNAWVVVATVIPGTQNLPEGREGTDTGYALPNKGIFRFDAITVTRFRVVTNSAFTDVQRVLGMNYKSFIGYIGEPLRFTTAPPDGSSIVIRAQLNRPYKDSTYVVDTPATLTV